MQGYFDRKIVFIVFAAGEPGIVEVNGDLYSATLLRKGDPVPLFRPRRFRYTVDRSPFDGVLWAPTPTAQDGRRKTESSLEANGEARRAVVTDRLRDVPYGRIGCLDHRERRAHANVDEDLAQRASLIGKVATEGRLAHSYTLGDTRARPWKCGGGRKQVTKAGR